MLARLQALITLGLAGLALGWLAIFWPSRPVAAVAGCLVIACGHALFLGIEFVILRHVNRSDPVPQAGVAALVGAWLGEAAVAPRVFCWRQPFFSQAVPDQSPDAARGRRGVVLVHGFFCNRGFWTPWLRRLQADRRAFVAVSLEPVFGSIDGYAAQIDAAVRRVTLATGLPPVVVCHSMGGLAVRAWLRQCAASRNGVDAARQAGEQRLHHVVTLGTPHRGTWLARFGHSDNGRQMRWMSDWQAQLDHGMAADRHARFTCWYSNADNIVFPSSSATLPGADNRLVRGKAHVQMAFLPEVMAHAFALIGDSDRAVRAADPARASPPGGPGARA